VQVVRPAGSPGAHVARFGTQLAGTLPALLEGGLDDYHAYAFATVRMAGAAFEILGDHARWLLGDDAADVPAATGEIVDGCKALSFRLARRRPFDPEPSIAALAGAWERVMTGLASSLG